MDLISSEAEIFVQIAAYRDPELLPTVADCIERAARPDRLTFGICWQHAEGESIDPLLSDPRVRVISVDAGRARGPCWARNQLQHLYDGEEYTLQLDSHHRFADGWDEFLVDTLEARRAQGHAKPLLTAYAPHYDPDTGIKGASSVPLRLDFHRFDSAGVLYLRPSYIEDHESLDEPLPARFYSAHYSFGPGRFAREVPHDPGLYFHGEEPTMSVRAFTHGYDLFHPHRSVVWHQYTRAGEAKHWEDDAKWSALNALSVRRQRQLLGVQEGGKPPGADRFGLGTARSVADFESYTGLDFADRRVQRHTSLGLPPPNPPVTGENDWLPGVLDPYTYTVSLTPAELPTHDDDVDFWFVGAHDKAGTELHRHDLVDDELADFLATAPHTLTLEYEGAVPPATWTVWPHSKRRGWLDNVTRPVAR